MTPETDIYNSYAEYHRMIVGPDGVPPLPFEQWAALPPYADEVARYEADWFLASKHPDGGNLAGFHGMSQLDGGMLDYVATKGDK